MTATRKVIEIPLVPPHMAVALAEIGVQEVAGDGDNPRIVEYHGATGGGEAPDSVYWCASFCNWCFAQIGVIGTRTKAARDWIDKPPPGFVRVTGKPQLGDVVILDRSDPDNPRAAHVTFWLGPAGPKIFYGVGGNQADKVGADRYARALTLGVLRYVGPAVA